MTGNELKNLLNDLIKRDALPKDTCQEILKDLEKQGGRTLDQEYINEFFNILNLMYKTKYSNNNQWGELYDREFADWKRVRGAIEHENMLINQRLTWLFLSQTVLLTAFISVFVEWSKVKESSFFDLTKKIKDPALYRLSEIRESVLPDESIYIILFWIIGILGFVISIHTCRITISAVIQINKLERWWYGERDWKVLSKPEKLLASDICKDEELIIRSHPPLKGRPLNLIGKHLINAETIPVFFLIMWPTIGIFVFNRWHFFLDILIIAGLLTLIITTLYSLLKVLTLSLILLLIILFLTKLVVCYHFKWLYNQLKSSLLQWF